MHLRPTSISGLYTVDIAPRADDRGFFARTWDPAIARQQELVEMWDYSCISTNTEQHTLRGMHYQQLPHGETKLVRCTKGAMFDAAIDLRPESPTFKQWFGMELSADNHRALYIPAGCAHGFLTLQPDTEVLYMISGAYVPDASAGVRWDDPTFAINWPTKPDVIAERDATYPDFAV
jgi:dTDP-4-dehydrorhamnose 3,5-epimerase